MPSTKSANKPKISIRFDTNQNGWVSIDPNNPEKALKSIPVGSVIKDVTFSTKTITTENKVCGVVRKGKTYIGIATGTRVKPSSIRTKPDGRFSFDADHGFIRKNQDDFGGKYGNKGKLTSAKVLHLLDGRSARVSTE
jgi:hypothetical protein